ncbi:hypothetical protein [Fortiea contorta]|uniref:hypothetical protein n=1 Tax=Fortiea contorta TaxID=1892405 RepID=UPI00034C267B|nr:hypothetical protein [Fortiea contorta]
MCGDEPTVSRDFNARIMDNSFGKARQATALMKVNNAASFKAIGNHRRRKLGGHYF